LVRGNGENSSTGGNMPCEGPGCRLPSIAARQKHGPSHGIFPPVEEFSPFPLTSGTVVGVCSRLLESGALRLQCLQLSLKGSVPAARRRSHPCRGRHI